MIITHDIRTLSSFAMWLDNVVTQKGVAFTNYSGELFRTNSSYQGLYAYSAPFKSLVSDLSINNANILSGVYLNGTFVNVGTSGLASIDHTNGVVYFNSQLANSVQVSGRYAIKEVNVKITDSLEQKLLLETKYVSNSRYGQNLSGLPPDSIIAPIIFVKYKQTENKPFSFGGLDDNSIKIRCVGIFDNEYQKIGVGNILKNLNLSGFNIVTGSPLDFRGHYTGLAYNYNNLSFNSTYSPFIRDVRIFDVPQVGEYENLPRNALIADFEIFCAMRHNT